MDMVAQVLMLAFHIALIRVGKICIQPISLQLWVNSGVDWALQPWYDN